MSSILSQKFNFISLKRTDNQFILILAALALSGLILLTFYSKDWPDEILSNVSGKDIFFVDTSGQSCLTFRQACGIESAAKANPQTRITLYTEKTPIINLYRNNMANNKEFLHCPITSVLLEQMNNIEIVRENLVTLLEDTPLWQLYQTGSFNRSSWRLFHVSDAVRVALLWKKGGLYLDMDCIVLRSLHSLSDTIGTVKYTIPHWVENGVMAFSAGHPFLNFLMKYMVMAFEPDNYISLGPDTLRDAIFYFCNRNNLPVNNWMRCRHNSSIFIQPPNSFYAINSSRMETFYKPELNTTDDDWNLLHRESFLSHIYGSGHGRVAPPGSLYAKLAQKYCPISYTMAEEANAIF